MTKAEYMERLRKRVIFAIEDQADANKNDPDDPAEGMAEVYAESIEQAKAAESLLGLIRIMQEQSLLIQNAALILIDAAVDQGELTDKEREDLSYAFDPEEWAT